MPRFSGIAVVIPAFNEEATLGQVVQEVLAYTDKVWVVDDGSTDGTRRVAGELPCRMLHHPGNRGKGVSLREGLGAALSADEPEAVITLDADAQHPPEAIPRLVQAFQAGSSHLVLGARLDDRDRMPRTRRVGNAFADFWIGRMAAGISIKDCQTGFRLYSAALLRQLPIEAVPGDGFELEGRLLVESARRGFRVVNTAIPAIYPETARPSHYRPLFDTLRIGTMVAASIFLRPRWGRPDAPRWPAR